MSLSLLDAAALLHTGREVTVRHDLGEVVALPVAIDCRGPVPVLIARTAAGVEMPAPLDRCTFRDGAA